MTYNFVSKSSLALPFMSQPPFADRRRSPFGGSLAFFTTFQEMYNDSDGSNSDIIKKSCTGFHPPGWVEGLFLVCSQKTGESFNELRSQNEKENGLCDSAQSGKVKQRTAERHLF